MLFVFCSLIIYFVCYCGILFLCVLFWVFCVVVIMFWILEVLGFFGSFWVIKGGCFVFIVLFFFCIMNVIIGFLIWVLDYWICRKVVMIFVVLENVIFWIVECMGWSGVVFGGLVWRWVLKIEGNGDFELFVLNFWLVLMRRI